MYCRRCGYLLAGLEQPGAESACPECGRRFDGKDPRTWADAAARSLHRRLAWIAMMTAPGPLWGLGVTLVLYLGAWATLGRRPIPMLDDPKDVSIPIRLLGYAGGVLQLASLFFPLISISCAIAAGVMHRSWRPWIWIVLSALAFVAISAIWIRMDPWRMLEWEGD